jgi:hypothetical protein
MACAGFALGMRLALQGGLGRIRRRPVRIVPTPPAHCMDPVGGRVSLSCSKSSLRLAMISAGRNAQALVEARPGRAQLAFDGTPAALSRRDGAHKLAERGIRDLRHGCDAK